MIRKDSVAVATKQKPRLVEPKPNSVSALPNSVLPDVGKAVSLAILEAGKNSDLQAERLGTMLTKSIRDAVKDAALPPIIGMNIEYDDNDNPKRIIFIREKKSG